MAIHGINYSDATMDGDLADCAGLSTRRYPYFTTRHGRPAVDGYEGVTAVYRYKDSVFTVAEEKLFWIDLNSTDEAQYLHTVMPGAKQFVTINTKVVVWPDKLMIDMTSNPPTVRDMAKQIETVGNGVTMTDHEITIPTSPTVYGRALPHSIELSGHGGRWFQVYTGLRWDEENGYAWDDVCWKEIADGESLQVGDVLIPAANGTDFSVQIHAADSYQMPPSSAGDTRTAEGYFLTVAEINGSVQYGSTGRSGTVSLSFTLHRCGVSNPDLRTCFRAGDAVSVSGHPISANNKTALFLKHVSEQTLSFAENSFVPCTRYAAIGTISASKPPAVAKDVNHVYAFDWKHEGNEHAVQVKTSGGATEYVKAKSGQKILLDESGQTPVLWLLEEDETLRELVFSSVTYSTSEYTVLPTVDVDPLCLTIQRSLPDLDYICEKDNRLWGVVNHQNNRVWDADTETWKTFESRLICASALGDPDDFYDYTGAYGGAYAVAVASEGDFTGICPYGDSVLAWKEKRLCKVMGDAPATYSLNEYVVDGVQSGAHGTQVNISETLIYKGVNGIYAYAGGTPRLISSPFGERRYTAQAAGTDGERYFITLTDAAGNTHLHSYDVQRGLWLRESGDNAIGYADLPVGFCALLSDGMLRLMDSGADDPTLEWYAQFTPFYETLDGKKRYAKLLLRLELGAGAHVRVLERVDGGPWKQIGMIAVAAKNPVTVPVNIARGDKMEFRLEGNGACTILGIQRQFFMHSEV